MIPCDITWGSKKYVLEIDPNSKIETTMLELEKLTSVPMSRQKLMARRIQLKPEMLWKDVSPTPGSRYMLIGTAEEIINPVSNTDSNSDNEPTNSSEVDSTISIGLENYDNSCYANAVLQTLRLLPGFQDFIEKVDIEKADDFGRKIISFFRTFPHELPSFITALRKNNPNFDVQDPQTNAHKQQDANEMWLFLLHSLEQFYPDEIRNLFEYMFEITSINEIDPSDSFSSQDHDFALGCIINSETKQLEQGIQSETQIKKFNPETKLSMLYKTKKLISKLPRYATIHLQRFCYKPDEKLVVKIVRQVKHSQRFDMIPYAAPELRAQLVANRENNQPNDGWYKLKAIITHKGRHADSGHYVTHVRVGEQWYRFDDQKVTEITYEAVEQLCGAGDWHCSYVIIYERD